MRVVRPQAQICGDIFLVVNRYKIALLKFFGHVFPKSCDFLSPRKDESGFHDGCDRKSSLGVVLF